MPDKQDQIKKWVATWERAGQALEEIKRKELQSYDPVKNRELIDSMLQWAVDHPQPRPMTGMVEMQRIFARLRNQK